MAKKRYMYDAKTGMMVDTQSSGAKKANTSVSAKSSNTSSTEKEDFFQRAYAEAAAYDISKTGGKIEDYQKKVYGTIYKPNASGMLGDVQHRLGGINKNTHLYQQYLKKGFEAIGMTEDQMNEYLAASEQNAAFAGELYDWTAARTGDTSVLAGKKGQELRDLKGLNNLYGYDVATPGLLKQNNAKSFEEMVEISKNFNLQDALLTVEDYYRMINSPVMADGLSAANVDKADYDKAADDILTFTGIDVRDLTPDKVQGVLEQVGGMKDTVDYMQSYYRTQDRWNQEQQKQTEYNDFVSKSYAEASADPEFAALSQFDETETDPLYKAVMLPQGSREQQMAVTDLGYDWNMRLNGIMPVFGRDTEDSYGFEFMSPQQREEFAYRWKKNGSGDALQYLNDISWGVNKQRMKTENQQSQGFADDGFWKGAAASADSVARNFAGEIEGLYNIGRKALGFDINEYDPNFLNTVKGQTERQTVGQNISENTQKLNLFGKNVPQMAYNALMSAADSTLNAMTLGGAASPMMGAGAFNASFQQKLEEGMPDQDAFIDALVEGGIEVGTEYFSIDALMKDSTSPLGYFLRNLITEPTEEITGFAATEIYDNLKNGADSRVNKRIDELRTMGYTTEDAKAQATREMLADLFETGFTAFLSGGAAATGGTIQTAVANQTSGKNLQSHGDEAVKSMLDLANTFHFDEDVQSLIDEQSAILNDPNGKGGVLSPAKIGRIFRETMKAVDENAQQTVQNVTTRYVAGELQKNGVDDPEMTDAVVRIVSDNGSAKPEDYQRVTGSRGAIAVVEGLTGSIDNARNLSQKAARIAEKAAKKNKNTTTEETTEATTEVVPEVVGDTDELPEEELAAADIPTDAEAISTMIRGEVQDPGEQNAESVVSAYQEGQDPVSYATQFKRAMQFGEEGRNLDIIKKSDSLSALTDYQKTKAYTMGRGMRVARAEEAAQNRKGLVKVGNVDSREIRGMKLDEAQSKGVDSISRLAKAVGFNVKFIARTFDAEGKANSRVNGSWDKATRTITIDINAGRLTRESTNYALMQTAGHELTHFIKAFADTEMFAAYQDFVFGHLSEKMTEAELDDKVADYIKRWSAQGKAISRDQAIEEIVADASGDALLKLTEADIQQMAEQNPSLLKKIGEFIQKWVKDVKALIEGAYSGQKVRTAIADQMVDAVDELGAKWSELLKNAAMHARAVKGESVPVDAQGEVQFSLQEDERLMQNATILNGSNGNVPAEDLEKAAAARAEVAAFMRDDSRSLNLPEDIMGNTFFSDAAYGGTEENTTVCPRSIGADAFLDAVSDKIGRPLTVAEQVRISQDVIGAADIKEPQCIYCYVAADRAAYREFLGKYIEQRDSVIEALKNGETDTKALYETFLAGRKDTPNMKKRFKLWVDTYQQGKRLLSAGDLANIGVLTAIQSDKYKQLSGDPNFAAQMKDALAYAQSASWAKKRVNYVAYNGHILKWGQNRINKLNSMYGLRMYSFSDFSPAFALENMQMVTDASVRGLKMLAYTKVPAFAEIFASTGMNINVSVFATEVQGDNGSSIVENNLMGADWKAAQKLRSEHENIGITFVATSDAQVEWALAQDWIDVCIPYHLVRTGRTIAEIMKYKNFTAESGDTKKAGWSKAAGNLSSIPAALHNNDRDTYMRLLEENNLEPRFARFVDNPNYMKLVNETRQSVTTSKPVQPIFNTDAAINALQDMANNGGYYVPIGGSEQRMYELADEFAGKVTSGEYGDVRSEDDVMYSIAEDTEGHKVVVVEKDILEGIYSGGKWTDKQKSEAKKAARKAISSAGPIYSEGIPFYITSKTRDEFPSSKYVWNTLSKEKQKLADRFRASSETENLIVATSGWGSETLEKPRKDFVRFVKGTVYMVIGGRKYTGTVVAGVTPSGENVLYDLVEMDTAHFDMRKEGNSSATQVKAFAPYSELPSTADIITQPAEESNSQIQDPSQITDRELLANVMESAATNDAELDHVRRYRKRIAALNEKQAALEETNAAIVNARKAGKRADAAALQNKADILAKQIAREDGMLLKFEAGKPLQAVVQRERAALKRKADERVKAYAAKRVETVKKQEAEKRERLNQKLAEVREKRDQKLAALRQEKQDAVRKVREEKDESFGKAKYRKRIEEDVAKLRTWVTTPTNKEHVPQFLRGPLGDMINALDFSSARSLNGGEVTQKDTKLMAALDAMNLALSKLREQQTGLDKGASTFATIIDLPYGYQEAFMDLTAEIKARLNATQNAGDIPINRMTAAQLKELSMAIRTLTTSIRQMNRLLANAKYESAVGAANATIDELAKMTAKKAAYKAVDAIGKFMDWTNTVPYYAFKRFGKGGMAIFDGLMNGWDKLAFNSDLLVKFANSAYTTKEVRTWSNELRSVDLSNGETVQMTTAQLMSLYCLSKRAQAVGHLLGGGIRIADIESKGKRLTQSENYTLNESDLATFSGMLTDRQRQVADKLQEFMSTKGAEWGNEVSMKRFGYEMFTERYYFPIETDSNNRIAVDEQAEENSLFRLLNMSATKALVKGANNALVVRDIFDVFTAHSSDMAKYNALGLQILDALKWLNYVEKTQNDDGTLVTRSVQKSLERAYGKDARQYIMNLLRDLNGVREGGRNDGMVNKVISNAKIASVAGNVRVWMLQATSMPRAAYAINPKYLAAGFAKMTVNPRKGMKLAEDKVGIAKWKSMGFYDTNISGNIREMVKHDQNIPAKIREKSMAPAGFMDAMTMGVIYYAAEAEVAEKYRNTPKGSVAWDKLVNDRVRDIVYQTQVVDSTMTRSDAMRGKGIITLATNFMSEPTLTMNMLADSIYDMRMKHRGAQDIKAPTAKLAKALSVFTLTAALTAAVEALFDAERDDDEYETFGEKYMDAFIGDLTGDDSTWDKVTKVLFSNVGSNLNILNNIPFASDAMSLLEGYDNSPMYSAYVDSFKSSWDAYKRWMDGTGTWYAWVYNGLKGVSQFTGLPISNLAREGISAWNTFVADWAKMPRIQTYTDSRKDAATAYYAAINVGDTERAAFIMERAQINGQPEDKIENNIATLIKDDYISGNITEAVARRNLAQYAGKNSEDINTNIKEWSYQRETGYKYDDMKADYISGAISKPQMQQLLMKYRGMDDEEVYWKLSSWDYAKTHDGEEGGKYSWFIDAVDAGSGYQRYADDLLAHGVDKSDIASQITKEFKPRYIEVYGTAEGDRLREHLLDVYEYIGYERDYEWKRYMSKWVN